jgi:hypothetical protein
MDDGMVSIDHSECCREVAMVNTFHDLACALPAKAIDQGAGRLQGTEMS